MIWAIFGCDHPGCGERFEIPAEQLRPTATGGVVDGHAAVLLALTLVTLPADWEAKRDTLMSAEEGQGRRVRVLCPTHSEWCSQCGGRSWEDADAGGRCVNCGTVHPSMRDV